MCCARSIQVNTQSALGIPYKSNNIIYHSVWERHLKREFPPPPFYTEDNIWKPTLTKKQFALSVNRRNIYLFNDQLFILAINYSSSLERTIIAQCRCRSTNFCEPLLGREEKFFDRASIPYETYGTWHLCTLGMLRSPQSHLKCACNSCTLVLI